jgi:DNA-binding NarL/FixJ family response regulator
MAAFSITCDHEYVPTTVLVVDDHPSFRATARALLEAEGFSVIGEAADGEEALAKTVELHPDFVLLDIQLPDLDGFEVARRLEANGASPAIVLVSSRDAADYGDLISASGARGFVPKGELTGAALRALLP